MDLETWMKPAVGSCGYKYYGYVATWIYDGMAISDNPIGIIKGLETTYFWNYQSWGNP